MTPRYEILTPMYVILNPGHEILKPRSIFASEVNILCDTSIPPARVAGEIFRKNCAYDTGNLHQRLYLGFRAWKKLGRCVSLTE